METRDRPRSLRRHERIRLGGNARLIVDHHCGAISVMGRLIDLSEGGCQLRVQRGVDAYCPARVRLDIGGTQLWFPVLTRWVQRQADEWTVGCAFDGLTPDKHQSLRILLAELSSTR